MTTEPNEIRWCPEIGVYAIDRPPTSCAHKTEFCKLYCYNIPIYAYRGVRMRERDKRNEDYWQWLTGQRLYTQLSRKKKPVKRLRLCTRGEAFSTKEDVQKVVDLMRYSSSTLFWIPTRAWHHPKLKQMIEHIALNKHNARILASIDPSDDENQIQQLKDDGWSTVRIGANQETRYRCPKTFEHKTGHCATCTKGCFSDSRVDVQLKLHWGSAVNLPYKGWGTKRLF